MTEGVKTIIYPVKDLAKTKTLYGELAGVEPYADEAYYVGFNVEGQDVGLDPHGHSQGMTSPVGSWHIEDINKSLKALLDAGAEALQEVKDVGGGKLITRPPQTHAYDGAAQHLSTAEAGHLVYSQMSPQRAGWLRRERHPNYQ